MRIATFNCHFNLACTFKQHRNCITRSLTQQDLKHMHIRHIEPNIKYVGCHYFLPSGKDYTCRKLTAVSKMFFTFPPQVAIWWCPLWPDNEQQIDIASTNWVFQICGIDNCNGNIIHQLWQQQCWTSPFEIVRSLVCPAFGLFWNTLPATDQPLALEDIHLFFMWEYWYWSRHL